PFTARRSIRKERCIAPRPTSRRTDVAAQRHPPADPASARTTAAGAAGRRPSRGAQLHVARIAGVDVYLDWSLLIIFFLISTSLGSGLFPVWHPEWSAATAWLTAFAAA